jgi:hypothetical protein
MTVARFIRSMVERTTTTVTRELTEFLVLNRKTMHEAAR